LYVGSDPFQAGARKGSDPDGRFDNPGDFHHALDVSPGTF
jgi:hypothetical protein